MKRISGILVFILILWSCTKNITVVKTNPDPDTTDSLRTDSIQKNQVDLIPAFISVYTGDQQVGPKGTSLPESLTVIVKNKKGIILEGIPVSFTPGENSGQVSAVQATTDVNGLASVNWQLGPQVNPDQTVIARVAYNVTNLTVRFHANSVDYTAYNFVGTVILDSAETGDSMKLAPPFPSYDNNVSYPLTLDSVFYVPALPSFVSHGQVKVDVYLFGNVQATDQNEVAISFTGTRIQVSQQGRTVNDNRISMTWTFKGTLNNNILSGVASLHTIKAGRSYPSTISSTRYGHFTAVRQ